jgi:hypothetical protein
MATRPAPRPRPRIDYEICDDCFNLRNKDDRKRWNVILNLAERGLAVILQDGQAFPDQRGNIFKVVRYAVHKQVPSAEVLKEKQAELEELNNQLRQGLYDPDNPSPLRPQSSLVLNEREKSLFDQAQGQDSGPAKPIRRIKKRPRVPDNGQPT